MVKSIVWKRLQHHPLILPTITGHFHITPFMNTSNSVLKLVNWGELINLLCRQAVQGSYAFDNLKSSSCLDANQHSPSNIYQRASDPCVIQTQKSISILLLSSWKLWYSIGLWWLKKMKGRWTTWGPHIFRKDGPCICKYHLSVKTMREINIKWAVNEVGEKLGYLKARAPPVISRT